MNDHKDFAESIRPAVKNVSDKYSWLLYRRVLREGREAVYLMAVQTLDGWVAPDIEGLRDGRFMPRGIALGRMTSDRTFIGNRLSAICTPTPGQPRNWAFTRGWRTDEWTDITDWFWMTYQREGRCRFFRYAHEWIQINRNSRKCAYCGKHERREIVTRKTIEREAVWA